MKTKWLNVWNKIKNWLWLLPAFFFVEFFVEIDLLKNVGHNKPDGYMPPPFFFLIEQICFGQVLLIRFCFVLLFVLALISLFYYRPFLIKFIFFGICLFWFVWASLGLFPSTS